MFRVSVPVRWSDMDVFQHINHARMVTLLEEARIPWLLTPDRPTAELGQGAVVVEMKVRYRGQLRHSDGPLQVDMWVERLRSADWTIGYEVRPHGAENNVPAAVTASIQLAAFDIDTQRLRRLTTGERAFLAQFLHTAK
ncbi:acyl-CoA thioesterase [Hoyosella altamirensis]|uniref:acyl-CoA thioesterase n=1 Tax=Hoyosella altamirensis TaxID=616997 RepID=UPI0022B63DD1|nr:thioesterase family protein [Hoyosella altamirensis]